MTHICYTPGMECVAKASDIRLIRSENFRENLRRCLKAWATPAEVARNAGMGRPHFYRILKGVVKSPTLETVEAISVALDIPIEVMISKSPSDRALRITDKK